MGDVELGVGGTPALDVVKSSIELHCERVEPSNAGYAKLCVAREPLPETEDSRDLVAFTQVEFLVSEAEDHIDIQIARRGPATATLEVEWITENANTPPDIYFEQTGKATFAPGEKKVTITLVVGDNPQWSTEAFQYVKLLEPADKSAAVLGELFKTTLVILNDDPFPQGVEDLSDQARSTCLRGMQGGGRR